MNSSGEEQKLVFPKATLVTVVTSYSRKSRFKLFGKANYSEKELIIGCMNGDDFFQKILYDRFSPKMFGICLRYAADYHTAEDLLQEGFLKVFGSILSFRHEGSFEGWIRRIFVNHAIEKYRKSKRVIQFDEISDDTYFLSNDEADTHFEAEDLLKMIQALPDGYREIFNLYAIEGYSHSEIAEMLQISEGTSKSQLSRARALLKRKINAQNSYPDEQREQLGQLG